MRIMIIQSEIEEAIAEKVLSQMSINENCELKIELSATRGPEGMTATIDVVEKAPEIPLNVSGKVRAARKTAAPKAPEPVAEETSDAPVEQTGDPVEVADEGETQEEAAPAAPTNSIFGALKKPVNASSE